jgi:D-hydroxyproline dehydrogenase subunit beta
MSRPHAEVAVVGAGIVGLAHAWAAARRGLSVLLFERSPRAEGASVRNFGMIWPIGQPGDLYFQAMRSRDRWVELSQKAGIWVNDCGSLHLATGEDEKAVLEEYQARAGGYGIACELLTPRQAVARCPAVRGDRVLAALYSPTECGIDSRQALARLPAYLADAFKVSPHFGTPIARIEGTTLHAADGRSWRADRVFVCSGDDFETLYPAAFAGAGLRRCKVQMLRTAPQPNRWRLGPHIAGGLTLCRSEAFAPCPGVGRLRDRVAATMPDHVRHGIEAMASQNQLGEVVIGASHEYDDAIDVFDKEAIDALLLDTLRGMVRLPDERVAARWHGVYATYPYGPIFSATPHPGVTIQVAPGGAGMTMAFGLADAWWEAEG